MPSEKEGFLVDPEIQAPLKYVLVPLFFGMTTGPIYGGITGLMMNMAGTADMRMRVLRHTLLFGSMGLAFGLTGAGVMAWKRSNGVGWEKADDAQTRFASGCSAGLLLGLTNRNPAAACGACVSLGFLSTVAGYFEKHPNLFTPDVRVKEALKPVLIGDVTQEMVQPGFGRIPK